MTTEYIDLGPGWEIVRCTMPFPHVYDLCAYKKPKNPRDPPPIITDLEAYVVAAEYAEEIFTQRALSFATPLADGSLFAFNDDTRYIAEYELFLREQDRLKNFRFEIALADREAYCRSEYPGYLGELSPPRQTPWGVVAEARRIANGVYWAHSGGEWRLAVHRSILELLTSKTLGELGRVRLDYSFYRREDWAVPFHALYHLPEELGQLVRSKERLTAVLCADFPDYVKEYNQGCGGGPDLLTPPACPPGEFLEHPPADKDKKEYIPVSRPIPFALVKG